MMFAISSKNSSRDLTALFHYIFLSELEKYQLGKKKLS